MTDKQIIIDGVDVAECQYLYFAIEDSIIDYKEYPRCSIGEAFTNNACKNSNCYYKQLKAKEQELKSCREEIRWLHKMDAERNVIKSCMINTIVNLEEENSKLKAENEELKNCLAEIKEIAEAITNGTHFSDDVESHLKEMVNKILEKINEVENDF